MPGSTPISVPSSAPTSPYIRLTCVSATPKPVPRCWRTSMRGALAVERPGPDRQLQLQADDEHQHGGDGEDDAARQRGLPAELVAREARDEDEEHGAEDDARPRHGDAEHDDGAEHEDQCARPECR